LLGQQGSVLKSSCVEHVEKIHMHPTTCDPELYPSVFREGLLRILEQYTTGYCTLQNGEWIPTQQSLKHPVTVAP
jgi:hypothetical protein